VTPPFDIHTRARSLPGPVEDADLVEEVALDLLTEFAEERVRKLGVRVSKLQFTDGQQASLDGFDETAPTTTDEGSESTQPDTGGQRSLGDYF